MLAVRVIEHFDILNDVVSSLLSRFVAAIRRPFPLETAEKVVNERNDFFEPGLRAQRRLYGRCPRTGQATTFSA